MIAIPIVIIVLFLLWLFLIAPKNRKEMERFKSVHYAHRGLHNAERAENSMSAFKAAVDGGWGIELDIRLSKDGKLVVFHDDTLDRVCGREGKVIDFTAEELATFKLKGTEDGVPLFSDVLKLVDGKIPLLVEIKEDASVSEVGLKTAEMLKSYSGPLLIESFNPLTLGRIREALPQIPRGLLCDHYTKKAENRKLTHFLLQWFLLNFKAKPDFYAYNHENRTYLPFRLQCRLYKRPTFAWTVRTQLDKEICRESGFTSIIFEDFNPKEEA